MHSDLWGPTPVNSIDGFRFYVLFVDHYTRFTWLYLPKSKSEVFTKFTHFKAMVETQFSTKIKIFRSDGGGEYISNVCKTYLYKVSFTSSLALILLNKMALLRENTDILLRHLSLFCLKPLYLLLIGHMPFKQLFP